MRWPVHTLSSSLCYMSGSLNHLVRVLRLALSLGLSGKSSTLQGDPERTDSQRGPCAVVVLFSRLIPDPCFLRNLVRSSYELSSATGWRCSRHGGLLTSRRTCRTAAVLLHVDIRPPEPQAVPSACCSTCSGSSAAATLREVAAKTDHYTT